MSINPIYSIRDWDSNFEKSESRKIKNLTWIPIPNSHDKAPFRRLAKLPNSPEIFAAWVLIVQVASKMPVRGVLENSDGPLTSEDFSLMTGFPVEIFEVALKELQKPGIRWIIAKMGNHPDKPGQHPDTPALKERTVKERILQESEKEKSKKSELENVPAHQDDIPTSREIIPEHPSKKSKTQSSHTNFSEGKFPKETNEFDQFEPNGKNPSEFEQFDQFSENSPEVPPSHDLEPEPILPLPQRLNGHLDAFPAASSDFGSNSQVQLPLEVKNREEAGQKTEVVPIVPSPEQKKPKAEKVWAKDSYEYETAHAFATEYLPGWVPSAKPASDAIIQKWATEVDLMQRIEGRSWEDINNLLNLIDKEKPSRSGFEWKKVILSMGALRQRWNEGKLEDLMNSDKKKMRNW